MLPIAKCWHYKFSLIILIVFPTKKIIQWYLFVPPFSFWMIHALIMKYMQFIINSFTPFIIFVVCEDREHFWNIHRVCYPTDYSLVRWSSGVKIYRLQLRRTRTVPRNTALQEKNPGEYRLPLIGYSLESLSWHVSHPYNS